ncbi:MAG: DNA-methyltransferase [Pseudohongiellaceae bacterium]
MSTALQRLPDIIVDDHHDIHSEADYVDKVFYKSAEAMDDMPDSVVDLMVTSPPYYNVKDYSLDGHQSLRHSHSMDDDIGAENAYEQYIARLLKVWRECERVLKPNGKLCINAPLMPMLKAAVNTHYNRHIYDLHSDIQHSILKDTNLFLMDLYIWNRSNPSKRLMFGSYPYPSNFYAQNTSEFIAVYVKDGKPKNGASPQEREKSRLTQEEWLQYTQQIWTIPIPGRNDLAFGDHPALMPEEIARRCIRMYSFVGGLVLDPFAGSGTTLKVAKALNRHYVGYEIYDAYRKLIDAKLQDTQRRLFDAEAK